MIYKYKDIEIKKKVEIAIKTLFEKDSFLLENKANERSVSCKLAEYLQSQFSEYNVDCEYNKKGEGEIKRLAGIEECDKQRATDRILPDIIVHKRNSNDNIVIIEIKTISNDEKCDLCKLKLFTRRSGEYRYQIGLYIKFNGTNNPELIYFENGKSKNKKNLIIKFMKKEKFKLIVDVHLFLIKEGKILLMLRENTGYMDGHYHVPAGHLEDGERIVDALIRESKEEIGISINEEDIRLVHVMHNKSNNERVAFFFEVNRWFDNIRNMEPEKCGNINWFSLNKLPSKTVPYAHKAIEYYLNKVSFSHYGWK